MKSTGKKRQALAFSLVIALAAAVTVNWYYSKSAPEAGGDNGETGAMLGDTVLVAGTAASQENEATDAAQTAADAAADAAAFSELQLKQTQTLEKLEEEIETVLACEQLDDEAQAKITALLTQMKDNAQAQTDCETLIKAKVGGQAIVLIENETAQVIVDKGRLNEQTALQITEIMENSAQISAENLSILEVNS